MDSLDAADSGGGPPERELRRRSRRSFITALAGAGVAGAGWWWLRTRPRSQELPWPVRKALEFNERVSLNVVGTSRLIAELPRSDLTPGGPRVNGDIGLAGTVDPSTWRLRIEGSDASPSLEDLRRMPSRTQVTPLNCIEGWTTVAEWTGVRLSDVVDRWRPEGRRSPYVGLETPDGEYYVGLDGPSAMHPQTLLCYAINALPLTSEHGAPVRLLIPTKYGVKNLKRVGTIRFSQTRPRDYWAEQGYDWFAGL